MPLAIVSCFFNILLFFFPYWIILIGLHTCPNIFHFYKNRTVSDFLPPVPPFLHQFPYFCPLSGSKIPWLCCLNSVSNSFPSFSLESTPQNFYLYPFVKTVPFKVTENLYMTTFNHQFSGSTLSYVLEVVDDFFFLETHHPLATITCSLSPSTLCSSSPWTPNTEAPQSPILKFLHFSLNADSSGKCIESHGRELLNSYLQTGPPIWLALCIHIPRQHLYIDVQ